MLCVGQIVACFAIGLMNVLIPGVVKRDFPHHVALMTRRLQRRHVRGRCGGGTATTVPAANAIAHLFDGAGGNAWAWALALWSLPVALATLAVGRESAEKSRACGKTRARRACLLARSARVEGHAVHGFAIVAGVIVFGCCRRCFARAA